MNEPPAAGVVRVAGRESTGAGFLVSSTGLIVTCAHVLAGYEPGDAVRVEPHVDRRPLAATVVLLQDPPDVAVLQLIDRVPPGAAVLSLGRSPRTPQPGLRTFGYPQMRPDAGLPGEIAIQGVTVDARYEQLVLRSEEATLGFSGAPIWDTELGAVVGMVKSIARADPGERLGNTAIGVPAEVIRDLCPELRLPAGCPYRGLEPFTDEHVDYYYGREHATSQLLASLSAQDFVAVVAVSGGGKSSLLQAGLAKGLRDKAVPGLAQRVRCYQRVGSRPHAELLHSLAVHGMPLPQKPSTAPPPGLAAAVLGAAPPAGLIVVADQFERLYTDCADAERKRFVELLLHLATGRVKVVIGLRADFYHLALADLGERLAAGQVALAPMSAPDLSQAITEPAGRLLRSFQPGLAQRLVADVRGRPGDLPLLQFALTQVWERDAAGGVLTEETYRSLGADLPDGTHLPGAQGALIHRAEGLWQGLSPSDRPRLQRVLLGLVAAQPAGTSAPDLSQPALIAQWDAEDQRLIQKLISARLLTADRASADGRATVEVSHEALLRAWPRLRNWLEGRRKYVQWRAQDLAPNLERWLSSRKSPASKGNPEFLLPPSLLDPALRWLDGYPDELAGPPAAYIQASKRRRSFRARIRQGVTAVLAALAIGLAASTAVAIGQRDTAISERNAAASNALVDQSEATGSSNPALARLEALAAWRLDHTAQARYAMLAAAVLPLTAVLGDSGQEYAVAFNKDGSLMATNGDAGTQLWNVKKRRVAATLPAGHQNVIYSVAFSPDGSLVAAGGAGKTQLWDVRTRRLVGTLPGSSGDFVDSLAFSPNGTLLATDGSYTGTQLWNVATHRLVATLPSVNGDFVNSVAFSPSGSLLAAETNNGVQLWNVATRMLATTLPSDTSSGSRSLAFSPDGSLLVVPARSGTQLWNVRSHHLAASLPAGSGNTVSAAAFSPGGSLVAAVTNDGTQLWNVKERDLVATFPAGNSNENDVPTAVAFSPDGAFLATTTGRIWLVSLNSSTVTGSTASAAFATLQAGTQVSPVAFSPDSSLLAAGTEYGTQVWNVAERKLITTLPIRNNPDGALSVAFSPDGSLLAAGAEPGTQLWNVKEHRLVATLPGGNASDADSVAFSPNGSLLADTGYNGTQLWNVKERRLVATLPGSMASSVAFSRHGSLLADAARNGIQIWNVAAFKLLATLPDVSGGGATSVAFSPDGLLLAIAAGAADTKLWNVPTRKYLSDLPVGPYNISFGPSKAIMLTATDSSVELWDPVTGQQFDKFVPPAGGEDATLSHNGLLLAIASGKAIQIWPVPYVGNTASYLCELAGESFPRAEWVQYAPGVPYMRTCP
jgi:WD40 repeat protein